MTPKTTLLFFIAAILFISCINESGFDCNANLNLDVDSEQLAKDIDSIDAYLADSSITAVKDPSGLRYVITQEGNGIAPTVCNFITVEYRAILLDTGEVVDRSINATSFSLADLISGWQIGLPKVTNGGSITLYVPSVYAYGESVLPGIPPNSNLIFNINLLAIN